MAEPKAQIIGRYRGTWRVGEHFLPGDRCVVGGGTYEALIDHVAGSRSSPGTGENWALFWFPKEGYTVDVTPPPANVTPFPAAASGVPGQSSVTVHNHMPQPASVAPSRPVALLPQPRPATPPNALTESDDEPRSDTETALALDSLSQRMARGEADMKDLKDLVASIARRLTQMPQALALDDDPLRTEAWRRKAIVLGVEGQKAAEDAFSQMLASGYRLLRKRDKGETWTAHEAAQAAVLDTLHGALEAIDDAAANLAYAMPQDISADRHWPRLGDLA